MREQGEWNPKLIEVDTKEKFGDSYSWEEVLLLTLGHIVSSYADHEKAEMIAEKCTTWSSNQGIDMVELLKKLGGENPGIFYAYFILNLGSEPEMIPEEYRTIFDELRIYYPRVIVDTFLRVEGLE